LRLGYPGFVLLLLPENNYHIKLNIGILHRYFSAPMSISVIIPTFNRSTVLPRAVRSVINQTRMPDEIIVVDDGSTDDTKNLIATQFPHIRYLYQKNQGASAARNFGIQMAKHTWIAFLDSDDEWCPEKLSTQWDALQNNHPFRLCHTNEIWVRNGLRINQMKKHTKRGGNIFEHCLPLCVISPSSVLIHHHIFDEIGGFDPDLPVCEDYDLWLRICSREPVLYIDLPLLIKYGGHADQLSHAYWGMDRFRIQALEHLIESGNLENKYLKPALEMLVTKIDIFVNGARKRNKYEEVALYDDKKQYYLDHYATFLS
jgi:glycosyltransferase involved in cell wall biosynthesis